MATTKKTTAAKLSKEQQAALDSLAESLQEADEVSVTAENLAEKVEDLRWAAAEQARALVRDLKVTPAAIAKELDVTAAYVRQLVTVAELYGEDDYRLDGRSYNDHLELSRITKDKRDAVAAYAEEYGCSIRTARTKLAEKEKSKVVKDDDAGSSSSGSSGSSSAKINDSGVSLTLSGKGGLEKLNDEVRTLIGYTSQISSSLASAVEQGARLTEEEAAELVAVAGSLVETATLATSDEAVEAAPKKTTGRKVRRNKAA